MLESNVTVLRPVNKVIPLIPESELSALLSRALTLTDANPHLLDMIDKDLDAHGLKKKIVRVKDSFWVKAQGSLFCALDSDEDSWEENIRLGVGRPRMPAAMVYLFIMIRGYLGGFKDKKTMMLLLESRTIENCLYNFGCSLPGFSTIIDNVNAVNLSTLDAFHDSQIQFALKEKLDDFKKLTFDSTNVKANSAWPTDSSLIMKLCFRAISFAEEIKLFGLSVKMPKGFEEELAALKEKDREISFVKNKGNANKKRAKLYRKQYKIALKFLKSLQGIHCKCRLEASKLNILPSRMNYIMQLINWLDVDVQNLELSIENSKRRINKSENVPASEKLLSLSDEDAAMICKGGREPTVGYRPQLGRSEKGLVTSLIVPEGNASDSSQLEDIVETSMAKTSVWPEILSFDDGYTNSKDRKRYKELEIEISFSGSKGKKLIPVAEYDSDEYKKARADRSAVESLMFVLKHNHDFESLKRRGIDSVRSELLEKVLVYNFFKINDLIANVLAKKVAA